MLPLISPRPLLPGSTIGVFTPSSPAYQANPGLFENGVRTLETLGFKVKLGSLTSARAAQGYRSGTPEARANEFMDLILDPSVHGLIATIGGYNSSSLIPFLDFNAIREARKPICGFSDVTSLHLAVLHYSRLRTFYGPTMMCWFGEWPAGIAESTEWFLDAVMGRGTYPREIAPPPRWSNHRRDWGSGDWKNKPREWIPNPGWRVLQAGSAEAPVLALNLNTMLSAAGTPYWPRLEGKILLLEEMDAPLMKEERAFRQLSLMGVFDRIAGLIIAKPEVYSADGADFDYDTLVREVVGPRAYPIVSQFDCGHTVPMITIPQEVRVRLQAEAGKVHFAILEKAVNASGA
jgi:muramoyltetrapeptide carboxypeptidase